MSASKGLILVVEDEKDLNWLIASNLRKEGYEAASAGTAERGFALARARRPDLVILDVLLPKMDGFEMIALLRRESRVPVLFLSAKRSETDRIVGFKLGADDYVTKPFSMPELLSRVKAILGRTSRPRVPEGLIVAGELQFDPERREVRIGDRPVDLAPREFEVLKLLMEASGKVLSRERILERLWGSDKSMDLSTRTVDQHVARIRRKLRSEGARLLTAKKSGYRFKID